MDSYVKANIDSETKRKAMFIVKTKGKNLSDVIRETVEQYAKEFDEEFGKEE